MSVEPVSFNALQVCGRDGSAVMLAAKRSAGVAPEVNLKEYVIRTPLPSSNKAAPRGDVTRNPKQGYQWAHKKDSYSPRIKKKIVSFVHFVSFNNSCIKNQFLKYLNLLEVSNDVKISSRTVFHTHVLSVNIALTTVL